ncbi:MAG TPA: serine/threonine-protein kinase [Polyangiaceae bacterium]|nr:serine/threonine-protein kinase [Polyangiaceae bacterium]
MIKAGQVLNGRYKLLRPLGQGSQAYVWVAEHLALGSQVAVKLIDPELAKQQDALERFTREATAAAKLRSAHVVQILDHGVEGDQPFIVMELLDGEDLFDRLEKRHRLTLAETSRIVTQVARALMRAHAEGIIHRDLKPENVFLVRNEDEELAKVLDFGVAKVMTPAKAAMTRTGVGTLIGTPHYMSPEQVKGVSEIDHRSDLWSLGVITYQSVTGELPFDSEGVGDLLIKITMNQPTRPTSLDADLPAAFDDWFNKACAKEPEDRFQTAREMADALAKAVGIQQAISQRQGMMNLADGPDLDWGSLAGVRIPMPPRPSAAAARAPTIDAATPLLAGTALKTVEPAISEMIEVDTESRPPPPPPPRGAGAEELDAGWDDDAPPAAPVRAAPPARPSAPQILGVPSSAPAIPPPPPSARRAPPPPKPSSDEAAPPASSRAGRVAPPPPAASNPFLTPSPAAEPPPPSRAPSSGRGFQSTVTGLASTADASFDAPPEFDGKRSRKAAWFVAIGVVVAAVATTVGVIRSRGGLESLTEDGAATGIKPAAVAPSASATQAFVVPPPLPSASAAPSSSVEAVDPQVTKKAPIAKSAAPTSVGAAPRPKPTDDEVIIETPLPYQSIPLPRTHD